MYLVISAFGMVASPVGCWLSALGCLLLVFTSIYDSQFRIYGFRAVCRFEECSKVMEVCGRSSFKSLVS